MSKGKGRNKRPKGTQVLKMKTKRPKDALNPVGIEDIPPALRPAIQGLRLGMERRVRYAEMKAIQQHQKTMSALDEIKSNQIVLQTLLIEAGLINKKQFASEYQRYITEIVGIVQEGQMSGVVLIDTFNIGIPPTENSVKDLKDKSKNPVFVKRG